MLVDTSMRRVRVCLKHAHSLEAQDHAHAVRVAQRAERQQLRTVEARGVREHRLLLHHRRWYNIIPAVRTSGGAVGDASTLVARLLRQCGSSGVCTCLPERDGPSVRMSRILTKVRTPAWVKPRQQPLALCARQSRSFYPTRWLPNAPTRRALVHKPESRRPAHTTVLNVPLCWKPAEWSAIISGTTLEEHGCSSRKRSGGGCGQDCVRRRSARRSGSR